MKPVAAVMWESSVVVIGDDGSVHILKQIGGAWEGLPPLPGSPQQEVQERQRRQQLKKEGETAGVPATELGSRTQ